MLDLVLDLRSRGVSLTELCVFLLIRRHAKRRGWCWRQQHLLAIDLDVSERTVQRAEARLVELEFAETKKAPGKGRKIRVSHDTLDV